MVKVILCVIVAITLLGAALWGPIVSNVEQAKYIVVEKHGPIEIRDYEPMIIAQVQVSGNREEAINNGFRIIADYISGNNISSQKLEMSRGVTRKSSEKIAMTAPVTQKAEGKSWIIRFVMPSSYTMRTLPKPKNEAIKLKKIGRSRYIVIRFSGKASTESLKEYTSKLDYFIRTNNVKAISQPTYSFFNPPWTLPFLRRNEVMIEVE